MSETKFLPLFYLWTSKFEADYKGRDVYFYSPCNQAFMIHSVYDCDDAVYNELSDESKYMYRGALGRANKTHYNVYVNRNFKIFLQITVGTVGDISNKVFRIDWMPRKSNIELNVLNICDTLAIDLEKVDSWFWASEDEKMLRKNKKNEEEGKKQCD